MFSRVKQHYSKIIYTLLVVFCLFVLISADSNYNNMLCKGVKVNIDNISDSRFLNATQIEGIVRNYTVSSRLLKEYRLDSIELKLSNNYHIQEAQLYKSLDGYVHAKIIQREPIVRVYINSYKSVYIDKYGNLMPVSKVFTSRVPIVSGNINNNLALFLGKNLPHLPDSLAKKTLLDDIFRIAKFISEDEFWSSQIEQLYVNNKNEFELYTKIGGAKIVLGKSSNLEEKFNKLWILFQKGFKLTGWNEFSEINLKFKNQVVCKKKL